LNGTVSARQKNQPPPAPRTMAKIAIVVSE
jgi:hypothetical protein